MTSGLIEACFGGLLVLASAAAADAANLDSLLRSLAREPPQVIAFVETRRSPLLTQDVVVSGVLEYRGTARLSRVVTEPYGERIDIDGSDVRIQRDGRPERRFSLRRSAELGNLLPAFSALLTGDRAALDAGFETSVEFLPDGWQLDLVPRQTGGQERIEMIRVRGEGDAPACIAVLAQNGTASAVIRLGAAARDAGRTPALDCTGPHREE